MPKIYTNSISRFTSIVNNGCNLHLIALLELKAIQPIDISTFKCL